MYKTINSRDKWSVETRGFPFAGVLLVSGTELGLSQMTNARSNMLIEIEMRHDKM